MKKLFQLLLLAIIYTAVFGLQGFNDKIGKIMKSKPIAREAIDTAINSFESEYGFRPGQLLYLHQYSDYMFLFRFLHDQNQQFSVNEIKVYVDSKTGRGRTTEIKHEPFNPF